MVFSTFFNFSLNLAIRSSWSEPQSAPGFVFVDSIDLLHLAAKNIINLILVLIILWCLCVDSSLVLLEDSVCYDQIISWENSISLFPAFFNLSLNLAIRSSWSEPLSAPSLVFADCIEIFHLWLKEYNQSDFGIDHLVMSMCRVFSCVVGRGCLLWPMHSLGITLLAFTLFLSVFQGQICLLLQVFLDFLLLRFSPL